MKKVRGFLVGGPWMSRSDSLHNKARTLLAVCIVIGFFASPWHGWRANVAGTIAIGCAITAAVCLSKRDLERDKDREQCSCCGGRGWIPKQS